LNLFSTICRERNYPFRRLDRTTSIGNLQKLVSRIYNPNQVSYIDV
jgi:DNA repair and recombination RAD54-like protein